MSTEHTGVTSLVRAAKALGVNTRSLRDQCLGIERAKGVVILIRGGSQSGKGLRYHVQWSVLREHLPQLFPTNDLVPSSTVTLGLETRLYGLLERLATTQETLDELSLRVRRLESKGL